MHTPPSIINSLLLVTSLWATLSLNHAQAQAPDAVDQLISIKDTQTTRIWTLISQKSFEDSNPGYGVSKGYKSYAGTITVYTYDLGFSDWQEGISDLRLNKEMDYVRLSILQAEQQGTYRNVKLEPVETLQIAEHEFLYFDSHIDMNSQRVWSAALLTVIDGNILKFRMSTGAKPVDDPKRVLFEFVEEYLTSVNTSSAPKTTETATVRAIRYTNILETDPLGENSIEMRRWLLQWITNTPDFTVIVCDILGPIPKDETILYGPELLVQQMFGNVSYQINNPDNTDKFSQQFAGVESLLKAYSAILAKDPKARIPYFDDLLSKQKQNLLKVHMVSVVANGCNANGT
jgi:hypothetical protein